jgi:hypothetical protein
LEKLKPDRKEFLLLLLCAALLLWQLFLPGFIGLANNGDYPKVLGPLCIGGADNYANNFIFFQSDYVRDPKFCWNPHIPSSENAIAWLAASLQNIVQGGSHFDIRWIAALHSLVFLGFYYSVLLLLRPLHPIPRIVLSLVALCIFADSGTVALFNSFFADTAGILGGLMTIVLAVHLIEAGTIRRGTLVLFGLAALLFVTSKAPHALAGIVPLAFVVLLTWRATVPSTRILAGSIAIVLLAGMTWVLTTTPGWYQGQARFNLVFFKIAMKDTPAAALDLGELGLGNADLRYAGTNAYMPHSPMLDDNWSANFCDRCTYGRVLSFYLHHPIRMLSFLWSDLNVEARQRRQDNLSNFRREDGHPAGAKTYRFALWSSLRSWLFEHWPPHILLWYLFALVALPYLAIRGKSGYRRAIACVIVAISFMAVAEFGMASLADACETHRHLLLFHVFTDAALFLAFVYGASRIRDSQETCANTGAAI